MGLERMVPQLFQFFSLRRIELYHQWICHNPSTALNTLARLSLPYYFVKEHNPPAQQTEPFQWQDEYGVLSVSESHVDTVIRYVDQQQLHHAEKRLDARLEMMS